MNVQETMVIMEVLKASYPRFYQGMTTEELRSVVNVWAMMFEDDNAKIVTEAVKAMITTLKFPPTIADIKEKIHLLLREMDFQDSFAFSFNHFPYSPLIALSPSPSLLFL
jgi:hypothetical protein